MEKEEDTGRSGRRPPKTTWDAWGCYRVEWYRKADEMGGVTIGRATMLSDVHTDLFHRKE